jgi:hypothetical protein
MQKESTKYNVAPNEIYPLTIVADRYGGTYSGAQYLARILTVKQMSEFSKH